MRILIVLLSLTFASCGQLKVTPLAAKPCTVAQTETGALISCPDGTMSIVTNGAAGANGAAGGTGPIGQDGADGADGKDAIPPSVVQFCPAPTTYPSTFSEVGLCINDNLYGVYWDGRAAALTLLPPGRYASTSTSSPCNFTVEANCKIINQ